MKVAVIGAGGVGGYFGGMIAKAGFDVTFVARGEQFKALKRNGIKIQSLSGDFVVDTVNVTDKISNIGTPDLIILGVKAWQVKDVAIELKNFDNNTTILPLQNGILAADELKEILKEENIIGGLCRIISKIEAPGIIKHFGILPEIIFGELNNAKTQRVEEIKEVFDKSCIKSKIAIDIQAELWKKFMPICTSGLLAIMRSTYGEIREIKETRKMMTDIINENYKLSVKMGININSDFVEKALAAIDTFPYDSNSSLSRDVIEGKPSEIEYQNGTAVKLGEKAGLEMPVNRFVYSCILPMERRARNHHKK